MDEVAAKHVDADLVVHYGHACLSATARLPVIYVFTKQPLKEEVGVVGRKLVEKVKEEVMGGNEGVKALVMTYDVSWDHVVEEVFEATKQALKEEGVELPLVRTYVDFRRNYDEKLVDGKSTAADESMLEGCCKGKGGGCACSDGTEQTSLCCGTGTCTKPTSTASSIPPPPTASAASNISQPLGPSRLVTLPPNTSFSDCLFLYLGPESLSLTNLLLTLGPSTPLISFNPLTSSTRIETGSTNRLLMKRYTSVLRARDASVVGLLVGTLGVHSYLPLLKYLRNLLTGKKSGRKVYTISVGKLNPAKLANFQEIDVFVLVACPENTLVDSKEFYKPIVTPWEMELAMRAGERMERGEEGVDWSGRYVLDLEKMVPPEFRGQNDLLKDMDQLNVTDDQTEEVEEEEEDDDRPHFSLISGTYVSRRKFNSTPTPASLPAAENGDQALQLATSNVGVKEDAVVMRSATGELTTVLETASIQHLNKRVWKGLEQRLGMDEPSVLEEGREGIAKGYKDAGGEGQTM